MPAIQPHHALLLVPLVFLAVGAAQTLGAWAVLVAERAEPARPGVRDAAVWARETAARAVLWALAPVDLVWRGEGPLRSTQGTPALLVADPTLARGSLRFLAAFLRARGRVVAIARLPRRRDPSLAECAEALSAEVDRVIAATGAAQVDLVGHGVGGIVAAWYLTRLDGAARTRRLVTLAAPWAGTRVAVFGRGRIHTEMLHGSPTLVGLAPPPSPTVAVWSEDDPFVVPSSSAAPEGALRVRVDAAGHLDMALSARVFRTVHVALADPLPSPTAEAAP